MAGVTTGVMVVAVMVVATVAAVAAVSAVTVAAAGSVVRAPVKAGAVEPEMAAGVEEVGDWMGVGMGAEGQGVFQEP